MTPQELVNPHVSPGPNTLFGAGDTGSKGWRYDADVVLPFVSVIAVLDRATLKATASKSYVKLVFLLAPEQAVSRAYRYIHGDTATADDISIIAPTDNLGRYYEYDVA